MTSTFTESLFYPATLFAFLARLALSPLGVVQADGVTNSDPPCIEAEQIHINHADAATIARVSVGIGISMGIAIFSCRVDFGSFASFKELMMVRGVGEVTLDSNESPINFV